MNLPTKVDWPEVFRNIQYKSGLSREAICRAVKVNHAFAYRLLSDPTHNPRFDNAARLINLHQRLLPDVPIPECKVGPS